MNISKSIKATIGLSIILTSNVFANDTITRNLDLPKIDLVKAAELLKVGNKDQSTKKPPNIGTMTMTVTATAYTSHVNQTDSTPNIAAWNDRLRPGMRVIAVSRDMLNKYGMKHRTKVRIKGLKGEYLVLDKMNKRWKKKIDIYMGMDLKKAYKWGRRKVEITWVNENLI